MTDKQILKLNNHIQAYANAFALFLVPHYIKGHNSIKECEAMKRHLKTIRSLIDECGVYQLRAFKKVIEKREDEYDRAYLEKICWTPKDIRYFRAAKQWRRKQKII